MKSRTTVKLKSITGSAIVLAAVASLYAAEDAPKSTTPQPSPSIRQEMLDAITKGKVSANVRLRYEHVDIDGFADDSDAFTIRTRLGYTSAPFKGIQGSLEFENVTAIPNDDHYNAAGSNGEGTRPPVADPQTTEVNQAWLSYSNWNSTVKGGRQHLVLDDARFVGDVGWRQNQQTFDAVTVTSKPIEDLSVFYGYLWEVHRVFGDVHGLPAGFTDFDSHSHLINVSYDACSYAKPTAYAYLMDLQNAAGNANSCATYGINLSGGHTFDKEKNARINYYLEYAYQTDYEDSPVDYEAQYFRGELSGHYDILSLGGGYELLGADDGVTANTSFKTPLATLHAFNGWFDAFLVTPAAGLQDIYAFAGAKLPGKVPLKFVYHDFCSDKGDVHYGSEYDVVASRAFGKYFTAIVKYAYFHGDSLADGQKFWAELNFKF